MLIQSDDVLVINYQTKVVYCNYCERSESFEKLFPINVERLLCLRLMFERSHLECFKKCGKSNVVLDTLKEIKKNVKWELSLYEEQ